jgi:hypothetical protein
MTARYASVVLVLDKDIRSDDLETLKGLLMNLKGVKDVVPGVVADTTYNLAYMSARADIKDILFKTLTDLQPPTTAEDIEIKDRKR